MEFQAVWLQGVYRRVGGPAVVPVLCGSFHPLMEDDREPEEEASYEEALEALAELLEEQRAGRAASIGVWPARTCPTWGRSSTTILK